MLQEADEKYQEHPAMAPSLADWWAKHQCKCCGQSKKDQTCMRLANHPEKMPSVQSNRWQEEKGGTPVVAS